MSNNFARRLYDWLLRPHLPTKISVHNGVPIQDHARLFDITEVFPAYEEPLIKSIRNEVESGDEVVIVGGGLGVSSVVAARTAGSEGSVRTYEASTEQCQVVQNTVELNKQTMSVEVRHAAVGHVSEFSEDEYEVSDDVFRISPADLSECNVLELDCEGTEIEILEKLKIRPRTIIVETHGFLGSSRQDVEIRLENLGYEVTKRAVENADREISILTAHRI